MNREPINIISNAEGNVALLSNFAHTPFTLDSHYCASVEGFIQGLKCEDAEKQRRIFLKHGFQAKRASTRGRNRKVHDLQTVWLQGRQVPFKSAEYYELIFRALRAKFAENEDARVALLETGEAEPIHDTGRPEKPNTSLPASHFITMLIQIRQELHETEKNSVKDIPIPA